MPVVGSMLCVCSFVPLGEISESDAEGRGGPEAEVVLQGGGVGVGDRHVAGLHRDELLVRLEVVVPGQHPGPDQLLLEDGHEVQQALRGAVADVVHHVRRLGKAVPAVASLGCVAHDPHHALHDVVYVGEVPPAVAVVEYFYLLTFHQFVREAEVGHVGPAAGAVDGEEPQAGGRYVVELAVGVGQQLVALLGGSV